MAKATSDGLFERYLRENGYDPGPHEPDLSVHGIRKRPDFLVRRDGVTVACEVKEFSAGPTDLERRLGLQRVATASPREVYGRIRGQVQSAAGQLRELTGLRIPLVVVLANPQGALVDLSVRSVVAGMYGNLTVKFQVDLATGGSAGEARLETGRDGKLTNDASYLSAVVVLRRGSYQTDRIREIIAERQAARAPDTAASMLTAEVLDLVGREELPTGDYLYVDVIETIGRSAVPLPEGSFDTGTRDGGLASTDISNLFGGAMVDIRTATTRRLVG